MRLVSIAGYERERFVVACRSHGDADLRPSQLEVEHDERGECRVDDEEVAIGDEQATQLLESVSGGLEFDVAWLGTREKSQPVPEDESQSDRRQQQGYRASLLKWCEK